MSDKSNMISFWRIVFLLQIMVIHICGQYNMDCNWVVTVDFFFVTGGWLMMKDVHKPDLSPYGYLWKRIKRLYPEYLPMFIINVVCLFFLGRYNHREFFWWLKGTGLREALLIQYWPWDEAIYLVNGATWYLSVMLVAGFLLFSLAKRCPKILYEIILPIVIISFYTYTYREYRSFTGDSVLGLFHIRFFRGFANMGIGMLLWEFNERFSKHLQGTFVRVAGFLILTFESLVSFFHGQENEYLYILLISVGILLSFNTPLPVFKGCFAFLGKISYSAYLHHNLFCFWLFPRLFKEMTVGVMALYICCVFLFSTFMYYLVQWLRSPVAALFNKIFKLEKA